MTEPHWAINTICRTYHKGQHHNVELIHHHPTPNTRMVWALVFDVSETVRPQIMRDARACFDHFQWDGRSNTLMPAVVAITNMIVQSASIRHYLGDKKLGFISLAGMAMCHDSYSSRPLVAFRRGRFRLTVDHVTTCPEQTEFQQLLARGDLSDEQLKFWSKLDPLQRAAAQSSLVALPFGQMKRDDFVFVENFVYVQDQPHYHQTAQHVQLSHRADFYLDDEDLILLEAHYLDRA